MVEANATTNLSEINADFVRLWQPAKVNHEGIRNIFVDQSAITEPIPIETPIGDEIETELVYDAPTNQQIPSLKGLLDYLSQNPNGTVNKYYTVHRKQQAVFQGDNHSFTRTLTQNNQSNVCLKATRTCFNDVSRSVCKTCEWALSRMRPC